VRKLRTRPPRFVALDNRAVDDLRLSVLDIGLLAVALRCPDGADFTVESLARKRRPGREALTGAMRNLVACGYVVKLKIQNVRTGTWRTEFSVADMPFAPDDVADIMAGVEDARAIRVEPQWLDPRPETAPAGRTRPTESRKSGATSADAEGPQVAPTDGFPTVGEPTVGEPTVGNPSAKRKRRKEKDSLSSSSDGPSSGPRTTGEREDPPAATTRTMSAATAVPPQASGSVPSPAPHHLAAAPSEAVPSEDEVQVVAERVADGWAEARERHGIPVPVLGRVRVARAAARLAAQGTPGDLLVQAATDMARQPRWLDLARHLEHWSPPPPPGGASRPASAPEQYCGSCDFGWVTQSDGRARKCPCRTRPASAGQGA
jgi:hypothetical protein